MSTEEQQVEDQMPDWSAYRGVMIVVERMGQHTRYAYDSRNDKLKR